MSAYKNVIAKVDRIIFYNAQTKWGAISIDNPFQGDDIFKDFTVVLTGNFSGVYAGCVVKFSGTLAEHPKYGKQIAIQNLEVTHDESSMESIVNFLTKSHISGISTQNAVKIYNKFKSDSIDIVLNHPHRLKEIHGIGEGTYEAVLGSIATYKRMEGLIKYCTSVGIPHLLIYKLDEILKDKALETIKENIFAVVELSETMSFKQLDDIAMKTGMSPTDSRRLRACLIYCIKNRVMMNSSTGCDTNDLKKDFVKLIGFQDVALYNSTLARLSRENEIIIEGAKVYYKKYYDKEDFISSVFLSMLNTPLKNDISEESIENAYNAFPFELNNQQKQTIAEALTHRISVITGAPGTGKSTITKALVNICEANNIDYELLSPTGKATRRLSECTGRGASTIHRFLRATYDIESATLPVLSSNSVLIIDEVSMLDIIVLHKLAQLAATTPLRFVLIGDKDQLPSVQAGNVLADLIDTGIIKVFRLTDITRQAEDSHIIKYCADINFGKEIKTCNHKDFIYEEFYDPDDIYDDLLDNYLKDVKEYGLQEVQVIAPYKNGSLGTFKINEVISAKYNKHELNETFGFRIGDKVMQVSNDYRRDVFNGETGVVREFEDGRMLVDFSDNTVSYSSGDVHSSLQQAYAITCHKSQGSEYSVVYVILDDAISNFLLTKKLLYTAVSRGKKKVYIYSSKGCLKKCIENTYEQPRVTKLCDFINRHYGKVTTTVDDWQDIPF